MWFCLSGSRHWWGINRCALHGKRRWRPSGRRSWWNGILCSSKRTKPDRKRYAETVWWFHPCNVKEFALFSLHLFYISWLYRKRGKGEKTTWNGVQRTNAKQRLCKWYVHCCSHPNTKSYTISLHMQSAVYNSYSTVSATY